jgi:hypothetical protein
VDWKSDFFVRQVEFYISGSDLPAKYNIFSQNMTDNPLSMPRDHFELTARPAAKILLTCYAKRAKILSHIQ